MRFDNFELIYSYTRKQALADEVLIEISQEAKKTASKYTPQSRLIIFTFISHLLQAWKERDNQPVADFMMYWKCSKLRHLFAGMDHTCSLT